MTSASTGEWLARQIGRRGVTVRQIAEALGVTTKTVYDWQSGKTAISEERVPRLAEILSVSELEARRGLGFWVPSGDEPPPIDSRLDEMETLARSLLDLVEEIRKGEPGAEGGAPG
jgi:transcriptional regulator with XRE-family HTH domain